jgi:hypothetical protein
MRGVARASLMAPIRPPGPNDEFCRVEADAEGAAQATTASASAVVFVNTLACGQRSGILSSRPR